MNVGTRGGKPNYVLWAALAAILALAAFLRLYLLGAQSLWADEMSSLVTALKPVPRLLHDISNEIHPPLYHLTLKAWIQVFGTTEAGIRSLSALCGVILVGLTYLIGSRLFDWRVGLLAAALSAIAPFQVYYSQEARMYMPLAMVGAAAVYGLVRFVEREDMGPKPGKAVSGSDRWPIWAGLYVIANGLGLWLHYSYPIVLAMENAVYALWLLLSWRRGGHWLRLLCWVGMQVLVVLIYAPWLPLGYRQVSTWPAISESHGLDFILVEAFRLFAVGESVNAQAVRPTVLGFALIVLVGLLPFNLTVPEARSRTYRIVAYVLMVCYVLFPIFMMYGLSLLRPAYRPKFFLVGSAAFSIALARGILGPWPKRANWCRRLSAIWSVACLAYLLSGIGPSLRDYYFNPRFARDDYRGMAGYIAAVEKPGDAVLLNAAGQEDVFKYYYRGQLPVYPLPRHRPLNVERTIAELEQIAAEHKRLYALFWATNESDPERVIEGWLDTHAYKALDSWRGNVRLVIYSLPQTLALSEVRHPLEVTFGEQIALLGYTLQNDEVQVGDVLQITLFWQALRPITERYSVFVHLLDAENHIIGQRDSEPGGGARLTPTWKPGETIADNYGILVRPGTPSGAYTLELGLYRVEDGQRLVVTEGADVGTDRVVLPPIRVRPAETPLPLDAFGIQHPMREEMDALSLVGYDLYRLGYEHEPEQTLRRGDVLHLNLYWQVRHPLPDLGLSLRLVDRSGHIRLERSSSLGGTAAPSSTWLVGEVIRDQHDIQLGQELPAGDFTLEAQLNDGQAGRVFRLGAVRIE
jgi:mannosyltransferase